jgi:hypothetical protein
MSLHQVVAHRVPRVHRTEVSGEMPQEARLALALEKYSWPEDLKQLRLEKSEHPQHWQGFVHLLCSGASESLTRFAQFDGLVACPPLGTCY